MRASFKSVAVIGENATRLQAYGGDSSRVKAFYEITPLAGILNRIGTNVNVTYSEGYRKGGGRRAGRARRGARPKAADVVIYVGGINHDIGYDSEGGDKKGLELPYGQVELIQQIAKANPRMVVVLVGGSPMEMDAWLGQSAGGAALVVFRHGRWQCHRARAVRRCESLGQTAGHLPQTPVGFARAHFRSRGLSRRERHGDLLRGAAGGLPVV